MSNNLAFQKLARAVHSVAQQDQFIKQALAYKLLSQLYQDELVKQAAVGDISRSLEQLRAGLDEIAKLLPRYFRSSEKVSQGAAVNPEAAKNLLTRLGDLGKSIHQWVGSTGGKIGPYVGLGKYPHVAGYGALGLGGLGLGGLGYGLSSLLGGSDVESSTLAGLLSGVNPLLAAGVGAGLGGVAGALTGRGNRKAAIRRALLGLVLGGAAGAGARYLLG